MRVSVLVVSDRPSPPECSPYAPRRLPLLLFPHARPARRPNNMHTRRHSGP